MNDHKWAELRARLFLKGRQGVTDNYSDCVKIADDFVENPRMHLSLSEIAGRTKLTKEQAARVTSLMVRNGFLESFVSGRKRYWKVKMRSNGTNQT